MAPLSIDGNPLEPRYPITMPMVPAGPAISKQIKSPTSEKPVETTGDKGNNKDTGTKVPDSTASSASTVVEQDEPTTYEKGECEKTKEETDA